MKLVMIIAGDEYVEEITTVLIENNFYATNIGTSGDFLQYGNTVLVLGVEEQRIDQLFELLKGSEERNKKHSIYHDEVSVYVINIENHVKMHNISN